MIRINTIFKDNANKLLKLISSINNYNINSKFPSMKKTIRNFNNYDIYDEILDFIVDKDNDIMALSDYLREIETKDINVSLRIKSEQSFN